MNLKAHENSLLSTREFRYNRLGKVVRDAGFQVFDIVDISYYDDRFALADMVFLNLKTIKDHNLGIYKDGFDIKKWAAYNPG